MKNSKTMLAVACLLLFSGQTHAQDCVAKPCAPNYVRTAPNFCQIVTSFTTSIVSNTACTLIWFSQPLPPEAKEALVTLEWFVTSKGSVGLNGNDIGFYSDANCLKHTHSSGFWLYEFSPVNPPGAILGHKDSEMRIPLVGTNRAYFTTGNGGTNGHAYVNGIDMIGYFD